MSDVELDPGRLLSALREWNPWWSGSPVLEPGLVDRDVFQQAAGWLGTVPVLAICGMRRAGKSTLMRQLIDHLLRTGRASPDEVVLAHFEEPVFLEFGRDRRVLDAILDVFLTEFHPKRKPWVFLDEIQHVDEWARWARATHDKGRANFVVSGSTSRIIEPELATVLTGRHITVNLSPFSFRERLALQGADLRDLSVREQRSRLPSEFDRLGARVLEDVLRYGGIPEVVRLAPSQRDQRLRQLFDDILNRDVLHRHEVRRPGDLEQVAHWFLTNTARIASYNRLKNRYGLSLDQVRRYAGYLEESYLLRQIQRFSFKAHERSRNPRKVYATDLGLRNAVTFRFSEDRGWLAETLVFQVLDQDPDTTLLYFQGDRECDFVVWRGERAERVVQVWYGEPDAVIPPRETGGLIEAMSATSAPEGILITADRGGPIAVDEGAARMTPLRQWLLDEGSDVAASPKPSRSP